MPYAKATLCDYASSSVMKYSSAEDIDVIDNLW